MDLFSTFKAKAEVASAEVHRVPTRSEAIELIGELLRKEAVVDAPGSYAVWADCSFLKGMDKARLSWAIPGLKFEVTRQCAESSKVGISQMAWAIADTGTLAQDATAVEQRLVSTLPMMHVALLPSSNLVSDLPSFLSRMSPKNTGYLAMITGPSRTADIERVLTIGIHGPERLVVVFVDDLEGADR